MKKIDAHSHIGNFGGWANVSITADELVKQMDEYEIEKTILCSTGPDDNDNVAEAFKKYPDRFLPLVFCNPLNGEKEIEKFIIMLKIVVLWELNFILFKMHLLQMMNVLTL